MALTVIAVSAILIVTGCREAERAADSTVVRTGASGSACVDGPALSVIGVGRVGPVRIGAPISDVASRCTVRDTMFTIVFGPLPSGKEFQGVSEAGRVVDLGGSSVVVFVDGAESRIRRIIVTDRSIRTESGIGVGTHLRALEAAHGRVCAGGRPHGTINGVQALPGVWFHLAAPPMTDATPITMISVQNPAAAC